jgi:hypothetical protein
VRAQGKKKTNPFKYCHVAKEYFDEDIFDQLTANDIPSRFFCSFIASVFWAAMLKHK